MAVVWMGSGVGCELVGMGVMGSRAGGITGLMGSGVKDDLWGGFTWDI